MTTTPFPKVVVFVSNGPLPTLTYVPDFKGLREYVARENAKRNDIILLVEYRDCTPDNFVEEGKVIDQSIPANEKVEKDTQVTIYVSTGNTTVTEKEDEIKLSIVSGVTGEFIFKYYIDGVLQEHLTVTKDVALNKEIVWKIMGSGVKRYAIVVENPKTSERKTLVEVEVDFDADPVKKDTITLNDKVFSELTPEPEVTTTTPAPAPETEPEPVPEETTAPEEEQTPDETEPD